MFMTDIFTLLLSSVVVTDVIVTACLCVCELGLLLYGPSEQYAPIHFPLQVVS